MAESQTALSVVVLLTCDLEVHSWTLFNVLFPDCFPGGLAANEGWCLGHSMIYSG